MALLDPSTLSPPLNVTVVRDEAGLEQVIAWIKTRAEIGLDVETNPLETFFARKCRLIQFGDRDTQWVIDLWHFVDNSDDLRAAQGFFGKDLHKFPRLNNVLQKIRPFLESFLWTKVGVNLWFEFVTFYWNFGIRPFNFWDCQLAERVIHAGGHTLKDFAFFSMEEMMLRYFGVEIDKSSQTSFDVDNVLDKKQYDYAALDTRFPFALKARQMATGHKDKLLRTMKCENDAVGAFASMHVNGERLDIDRWNKNTQEAKDKRKIALDKLDSFFLPVYGSKKLTITDEHIAALNAGWKKLNEVTAEELAIKSEIKALNKFLKNNSMISVDVTPEDLEKKLVSLTTARVKEKDRLKEEQREWSRKKTAIANLSADCPGDALINYDSPAQIYKALIKIPGLSKLKSSNDKDMKPFKGRPVIDALRDYREWNKRVETYGETWTKEWTTHPCNDEGWLSPYTHKLHSMYHQLMAATGRTSSDNPNGQNLPGDKEVRMCFIADPGEVYITCDLAGAELRILAEMADAKTWISAFLREEDLHSFYTELFFPVEWKSATLPECEYYKLHTEESVAKNPHCKVGTPMYRKCECPGHLKKRKGTKAVNFALPYGAVPSTISEKEGIPLQEVEHTFALHEKNCPDIWAYLSSTGLRCKNTNESRDLIGRRRILPAPTHESARKKCLDKKYIHKLEYPEHVQQSNIEAFITVNGRKPNAEEKFWLTHREPNQNELTRAYIAINRGIERQGKNHECQASNASIIKIAMGSGKSPGGMPYLFHTLPLLGCRLIKMIHDEIVVSGPPENSERVAKMIGIAFKTAAREAGMNKVVMEFEYCVSKHWGK